MKRKLPLAELQVIFMSDCAALDTFMGAPCFMVLEKLVPERNVFSSHAGMMEKDGSFGKVHQDHNDFYQYYSSSTGSAYEDFQSKWVSAGFG